MPRQWRGPDRSGLLSAGILDGAAPRPDLDSLSAIGAAWICVSPRRNSASVLQSRTVDNSRIFVAEDECSVPSLGQSDGGPRDDDPCGDRDDDKGHSLLRLARAFALRTNKGNAGADA